MVKNVKGIGCVFGKPERKWM